MQSTEGSERQANWLIVEQDGQRYTAQTFDRLLEANNITTITDENRELVAKVLVLMTLDDYLEQEITFSDAKEIDAPGVFSFERFNYVITAWTKIQGLRIEYLFIFSDGRLRRVAGQVNDRGTEDYINVPFQTLPLPSSGAFSHSFWGK